MFLDLNKNSSAPPHIANKSSRITIIDPNTPLIMLAFIFSSPMTLLSDPTEAGIMEEFTRVEVGAVNDSFNVAVRFGAGVVNKSNGESVEVHCLSVS